MGQMITVQYLVEATNFPFATMLRISYLMSRTGSVPPPVCQCKVNTPYYVILNDRLVNNKSERMWKEAALAYFNVPSQHLLEGLCKMRKTCQES
jgi:hypothetical protein